MPRRFYLILSLSKDARRSCRALSALFPTQLRINGTTSFSQRAFHSSFFVPRYA
jgi:hypothetical protein